MTVKEHMEAVDIVKVRKARARAKQHRAAEAAKLNPKKKCNPAPKSGSRKKLAPRGRKNPDAAELAAAQLSEDFHGRPAQQMREYEVTDSSRAVFTDLGRLLELTILDEADNELTLGPFRGVRCVCSPDRTSIYFTGGDQAVDLATLGIDESRLKDFVRLGDVVSIAYHTTKAFHDFEPTDYEHEFGEEGGDLPVLSYDTLNRRLFMIGGSYAVKPEGITN